MINSAGFKGYSGLMNELGVDPLPLLHKHRLPVDLGEVDEAVVPIIPVMQLMEESALVTQHLDFGLKLAARQGIEIIGPLAMAIQHSENVREAMDTTSRYLYVHSPAVQLWIIDPSPLIPDAIEIRLEQEVPNAPLFRQTIEHC